MKGLTDYQKFLVLRPLPPNTETDEFGNPVLKKDDYSDIDWDDVRFEVDEAFFNHFKNADKIWRQINER